MNKGKRMACFFLTMVVFVFLASSCGSSGSDAVEYEDPAKYVGVWYSNPLDGRGYVFYEDGRFEAYSAKLEEEPYVTGSGVFNKPVDKMLNFGYVNDEGDFVREYQFHVEGDVIEEGGGIEFHRLTFETDASVLNDKTVMSVPFETYVGKWENDSSFISLSISENEEYVISRSGSVDSGPVGKGQDYLEIGMENQRLEVAEDGGLKLEGTEGTFYPSGDERVKNGPHRAFLGDWYNEATEDGIRFIEDGSYIITSCSEENMSFGFSGGVFEVNGDVLTYTHEEVEHSAQISDGVMTISGIDGVFVKD